MYGATMGTLNVFVNGTNVWSLSGDQGDQWNDVQVSLSAFAGVDVTIEFVGTYGSGYTGDMAIDNIALAELIIYNGCTDATACNFDASANQDDGSCDLPSVVVMLLYMEFDSTVTCSDASACATLIVNGCTDTTAANYNPSANTDDGTCAYGVLGCTDTSACNYDVTATLSNGSCQWDLGCGCGVPAAAPGYDCAGNCLAGVPVVFTGGSASCTYAGFEITDCSGNVLAEMLSGCTGLIHVLYYLLLT